nr:selenide, water dikinase SelD [Alicyclobacillus sp.]
MGPGDLAQVMQRVDLATPHPDLLVGMDTLDDAGVFRLSPDLALVQTIDFFTPIVDDPYAFGQIAAANALSDVYAMGARPLTVLNVVGYPITKLPADVLARILQGGADKVREAGAVIVGGHSIDDPEPKYGMAVTGVCRPDEVWTNAGARPGDALVLTKPIGSGVLTTAIKRGLATPRDIERVTAVMAALNRSAAELGREFSVHACTDVTGFGLLGHALEMARASGVRVVLDAGSVPILEGAIDYAAQGAVPGGSRKNAAHVAPHVSYRGEVPEEIRVLLADAVTSGGLLMALPGGEADALVERLREAGVTDARVIGRAEAGQAGIVVESGNA